MRVREDKVHRADGSRDVSEVVEKPDVALIIPRDERLWLVEHLLLHSGRARGRTPPEVDPTEWARAALTAFFRGRGADVPAGRATVAPALA